MTTFVSKEILIDLDDVLCFITDANADDERTILEQLDDDCIKDYATSEGLIGITDERLEELYEAEEHLKETDNSLRAISEKYKSSNVEGVIDDLIKLIYEITGVVL